MTQISVIICVILLGTTAYFLFPVKTRIRDELPSKSIVLPGAFLVQVDEDGKQIGDIEWVNVPEPDRYPNNGFRYIEQYVSRLLTSKADFTSLSISSPDGNRGFGLSFRDKQIELSFSIDWRTEKDKEIIIRNFFKELEIIPSEDYLAGNADVPDAIRILIYPISGDLQQMTDLCKRILKEIFYISGNDGLIFTYD